MWKYMMGLQGQWSVRNSRNPECLHSPDLSSIACLEHPRDMYSNPGNSVLFNLKGVGSKICIYRAFNGYKHGLHMVPL